MNTANITAAAIARIAAADAMSYEAGAAVAAAYMEASAPVKASTAAIRPGKVVMVNGKTRARVLEIARNGVWVLRSATEGEWIRTGQEQIRERVSIKSLAAI
jgi:hypothetical protein